MTILDTIVAHKRVEIAVRKATRPLSSVIASVQHGGMLRDFRASLVSAPRPAPRVIAEIKRRSPSKGLLRSDLDPAQIARTYEAHGAAAISVLTDCQFFGGSLDDLAAARRAVSLPVLCKEFIIDPYQIYEARMAGADAVLLIAAILDVETLRSYRELSAELGMAALVEVHNSAELDTALASGASILGMNNRNLHTFEVSLDTTRSLLSQVPPGVVTVSESGIQRGADREYMSALGVDALLVGEGLITANDIAVATGEICGLPIRESAGV